MKSAQIKDWIKEKLFNKDFLKLCLKNLILIISIILFVILFSSIFGKENLLIGVALITGILMFTKTDLGLNKKETPFIIIGISLITAICNLVSFYNIYLSIFFNFTAIFLLMLISTVKLHYKIYMPFILMYIFAVGNKIPYGGALKRVSAILTFGVVLAFIHIIFNRKELGGKTLKSIFKEFNLKNESSIFTLKMAIGITLAMFFGDIIGLERGMWISITVMSLTQPNFEVTKNRIKWRLIGTVIGIICFFILFEWLIPEDYTVFLIYILAYIYTFIKNYQIQMVFVTMNSLSAAREVFEGGSYHSSIVRVSFIIVGVIITLFIVFLEKKFFGKKVD